MRRLHLVPEENEANGVWRVARMLAARDGGAVAVAGRVSRAQIAAADETWVHGMWLPRQWAACAQVLRTGRPLVRMTHGSLSPVCLARQSRWKKRLVAPVERALFGRASRVVVTGEWEREWCAAWGLKGPFETVDLKSFFRLERGASPLWASTDAALRLLYLGRRHPLKGLDALEAAAAGLDGVALRIEEKVFGAAKEEAFAWCDALVLPTLSENFGLVVAEALERRKRALTTDGAPAWANQPGVEFLTGYRDAPFAARAGMLRTAIVRLSARKSSAAQRT